MAAAEVLGRVDLPSGDSYCDAGKRDQRPINVVWLITGRETSNLVYSFSLQVFSFSQVKKTFLHHFQST